MEDIFFVPMIEESYSRQLDRRVYMAEMPYGYELPPPPADSGDFNTSARESTKHYPRGF